MALSHAKNFSLVSMGFWSLARARAGGRRIASSCSITAGDKITGVVVRDNCMLKTFSYGTSLASSIDSHGSKLPYWHLLN
mmetsp:Transcript_3052/g.7606  ORF Transcript_3052/g.7606 Transcript_3052/m.7606 type:complete len:80 (-) Transcript_3052:227-466(-)